MDNIVITDKLNLGKTMGIQQNEYFNDKFFDTSNNNMPGSILDYFHLINKMNDIDNRITILEKVKKISIENTVKEAKKLNTNMKELKETIIFENDICENSYNDLIDALHNFVTNWN
jgi:hypothetical protein